MRWSDASANLPLYRKPTAWGCADDAADEVSKHLTCRFAKRLKDDRHQA